MNGASVKIQSPAFSLSGTKFNISRHNNVAACGLQGQGLGVSHLELGASILNRCTRHRDESIGRIYGDQALPRDLLQPFPSDLMVIWPISARVNSPTNDDKHLLDAIGSAEDLAGV